MHIDPAPILGRPPADSLRRLDDDNAHEACDAARYRWLRDHCTHENVQELVALVRANRGHTDRQVIIDRAVDDRIAAHLLSREPPPL